MTDLKIRKQLEDLQNQRCDKCGWEINYDVENDPEIYLSGICTNPNCEKSFDIFPTGWKKEDG